jgi:Protein of unknown function (DUF4199)
MRYAITYGILAGLVILAIFLPALILLDQHSMVVGYLIMLVGLTLVFVGIKRFRDVERGGVVKFLPAFALGLGISLVASIIYVIGWEIYLGATDYALIDGFIADQLRGDRAAGMSAAALARETADMAAMRTQFRENPLFRMGMIFLEIFPPGLIVSLVSAALLRNPRFLRAAG